MSTLVHNGNGRRAGSLLSWDPLRLFDDLMAWEPAGSEVLWSASPVRVEHTDDGMTLSADMPGVGPDDVELTLQAGTLSVSGKRGQRTYAFSVTLGDDVDPDTIEADVDKGVLTVTAHKKPEAKPRKIALKREPRQLASGDK